MAYRSFRGGSGRLDIRLDTPPSINGHHPVSRLAPAALKRDLVEPPSVMASGGSPPWRGGVSDAQVRPCPPTRCGDRIYWPDRRPCPKRRARGRTPETMVASSALRERLKKPRGQ